MLEFSTLQLPLDRLIAQWHRRLQGHRCGTQQSQLPSDLSQLQMAAVHERRHLAEGVAKYAAALQWQKLLMIMYFVIVVDVYLFIYLLFLFGLD